MEHPSEQPEKVEPQLAKKSEPPKKARTTIIIVLLIIVVLIVSLLVAGMVFWMFTRSQPKPKQTDIALPEQPVKVAALGDITCDPTDPKANAVDPTRCQDAKVATLIEQYNPEKILLLGDIQYDNGSLDKFQKAFNANWGKWLAKIISVPGNHEYGTATAKGYFDYFNGVNVESGPAGKRGEGYYKTEINGWSIYALNSNCNDIGGCGVASPQYVWLKEELEKDKNICKLAFWHHPLFTSGRYFNNLAETKRMVEIWQLLGNSPLGVVLSGHDHIYERFARQDNAGKADPAAPREFVIGTGGKQLYQRTGQAPNSEFFQDTQFGYMQLNLYKQKYSWKFVTIDGNILDQGEESCVGSK